MIDNLKLKTDYQDCPGRVDNEGITNIARILFHFDNYNGTNSTPLNCHNNTSSVFAQLNFDYQHDDGWPIKVCYYDPIKEANTCTKLIPGTDQSVPNKEMAENIVVKKVLERIKGKSIENNCLLVSLTDYRPHLLKHQNGCVIVYDSESCTALKCPRKIYLDRVDVSNLLTYEGKPTFQYFSTTLENDFFSIDKMLLKIKGLKQKPIHHLTALKEFLQKKSDNIVHGIGCAEDLHPPLFKRASINQCRPLPFIIDGLVSAKPVDNVIIRTAIMDINSPAQINWNLIYSAITNYQKLFPTQQWMLNGIEK